MLEFLNQLIRNDVLWVTLIANFLAQFSKPFTYWRRTGSFDWRHIAETGGMPSSHSAMVSALAAGIGIREGFDSAFFAAAVVLASIVTYDAANVRREAGTHARVLNSLIAELLAGYPIEEKKLKEVLGHSYTEVFSGVAFGVGIMAIWMLLIKPLF